MLDERHLGYSSDFNSNNNILPFQSKEKPEQDPLEEAKLMHHRSIQNLADHLKISYQDTEQDFENYLKKQENKFDLKDERTKRMLGTAGKTHNTLQTRQNRSSKISF